MADAASRTYQPVKICIYCRRTRHSISRRRLGLEHIIPQGLGGTLLLPEASCQKCEVATNHAEQFCQKQMLGAFRYQQGLPSKKPKDRPATLRANKLVNGIWRPTEIPVADYPVNLILPLLPLPEIMRPHPLRKTRIHQFFNFPPERVWTEAFENVSVYTRKNTIYAELQSGDLIGPTGITDTDRFARMLAKIAHAYAVAELGMDGFTPLLVPAIHGVPAFPIHHLVGGLLDVGSPATDQHQLRLVSEEFHGRKFWVVYVRLFANLGWPEYICVSGLEKGQKPRLVQKMQRATELSIRRLNKIVLLSAPLDEGGSTDYLCADCGETVSNGTDLFPDITIKCFRCGCWNVTYIDDAKWTTPYSEIDLDESPEPAARAHWIRPSNSMRSPTSK